MDIKFSMWDIKVSTQLCNIISETSVDIKFSMWDIKVSTQLSNIISETTVWTLNLACGILRLVHHCLI